jgi:hypothetical protein
VLGIEQRAREHGQPMAQAGVGGRVAGACRAVGVQGQEDAPHARVFAHDSVSMRLSSKVSIARRCIGLQLSANIGVLQRRWPAMCASAAR